MHSIPVKKKSLKSYTVEFLISSKKGSFGLIFNEKGAIISENRSFSVFKSC